MPDDFNRHGAGANFPPDAIEAMVATLRETHGDSIERSAAIAAMADRLPAACEDDDTATRLADGVKACAAFAKNTDAARVSAKEPHLAAGRAVDGFFKKLVDPVDAVKARMSALLTTWQRRKADEERRRREAEAAEARRIADEEQRLAREAAARAAEAERLAREAATKAERDAANAAAADAREAKDRAAAARQDANVTKQEAAAKPAELSRARTDLGAVASLHRTWEHEVTDQDQVPRTFLTVDHAAIRAYIRASTDKKTGHCRARIDGVRIFPVETTKVR